MNILLTGSEGFIGGHLSKYLANHGHNIMPIDRKIGSEVQDIKTLEDIDLVIHLAAQTSVWNEDIELVINDNINAFVHIYSLCKKHNKRLIYTSSSCAINETSIYGLTKHFDDDFVKIYGGDVIGVRLHNVYGKNTRNDTLLGKCINCDDKIVLFNEGNNKRHFTYIKDVCEGIENAISLKPGVYNLYNPTENTTLEFVNEVTKYKHIEVIKTP